MITEVECPICQKRLSINQINKHLDGVCIPSKDKKSNLRQPQPNINYSETKIKLVECYKIVCFAKKKKKSTNHYDYN